MLSRTELVGRDAELGAVAECLAEALDGQPRVVLCEGEPGIGKTRLAEEVLALGAARGAVGAWGVGVDSPGAPPYWPWRQALRAVANTVDLGAVAREHRLGAELARLAPDVFESVESGPDGGASVEDRFRQFEAVARLLRHVSLRDPMVIVLDDAHWADEPSLLLLHHLVRTLTDERLLLVVNSRSTEHRGPLLTGLVRDPRTRQVHLRGLAPEAVRRQLALLTGAEPDEADVREVRAVTGGNPFFVTEMGRLLVERGGANAFGPAAGNVFRHAAGNAFGPAAGRPPPVTPTVRDAITARLDRLSVDCVRSLRAAAVLGREFPVALVASMVDLGVLECLDVLDEAAGGGLVEEGALAHERRFVHALVRDAIEAGLGTPERLRLHRRAAEALEEQHRTPQGRSLFDLARHWAAAAVGGDEPRAARWSEQAGSEAMRQRAYEEAVRLFRQAVHVGGATLDDDTRCRLLLGAAAAANLAGDFGGCLDACLEVAGLARQMARPDLVAEAALRLDPGGEPGFDIAIRRLCQEAAASLPEEAAALRARVLAKFAETFIFDVDPDVAGPPSEEALRLAEQCGDARALAAALRARQVVRAGPEGLEERERLAGRLLALSRSTADVSMEMAAHSWQIDAALERGDLGRAAVEVDALDACAEEMGGPFARFQALSSRAVVALAQARFADALRLEGEAFTVLAPTGHPARFPVRAGVVSMVGRQIGHDSASVAAALLADAPPELRDMAGLIGFIARAQTFATAGRLAEAAEVYRALKPVDAWRPPPHVVLLSYAFGVVVAIALEERADVALLRDRLAPYRGHHAVSGTTAVTYFGPVELWLGVAAHYLGRVDDAVADLEQAERLCAASGAPGYQVEAQYELAAALTRRSGPEDLERARSLLAGRRPRPRGWGWRRSPRRSSACSRSSRPSPDAHR